MPVTNLPETNQESVIAYWDTRFNCEALILRNQSGAAATLTKSQLLGQPVLCTADKAALLAAAAQDTANGIIVAAPEAGIVDLANNTDSSAAKLDLVLVLRRGPALIQSSGIATTDAQAAAFTRATVEAALLDEGIKTIQDSTVNNVQTT